MNTDQYPVFKQLNWTHDNISQGFDSYWDNTAWRSSHSGSNYQIYTMSNQLQFNYDSGKTAGNALSWTTAGYIDTSGVMNWNKVIKTSDTTDASSTTTGSLRTAGGLGVTKKAYIGDSLYVNTTSATAKIVVVAGGVANVASEDSSIRATGSSNATKIEIDNTSASGHRFEMRSTNAGNFDITDRTSGITRFTILGARRNFGFNATPIASGDGNLYIGSGLLPAFAPACLCTQGGNLYWLSQGGKTTTLATNV